MSRSSSVLFNLSTSGVPLPSRCPPSRRASLKSPWGLSIPLPERLLVLPLRSCSASCSPEFFKCQDLKLAAYRSQSFIPFHSRRSLLPLPSPQSDGSPLAAKNSPGHRKQACFQPQVSLGKPVPGQRRAGHTCLPGCFARPPGSPLPGGASATQSSPQMERSGFWGERACDGGCPGCRPVGPISVLGMPPPPLQPEGRC